MNIGKAIFAKLTADTTVNAIVGTRVYPLISPDDVFPFVTYEAKENVIKGLSYTPQLLRFNVKLTVIAESYSQAETLNDAVIASMKGLPGTWGGVIVHACTHDDSDDSEVAENGNAERMFFMGETNYLVHSI